MTQSLATGMPANPDFTIQPSRHATRHGEIHGGPRALQDLKKRKFAAPNCLPSGHNVLDSMKSGIFSSQR
jgi:hypothetical protein